MERRERKTMATYKIKGYETPHGINSREAVKKIQTNLGVKQEAALTVKPSGNSTRRSSDEDSDSDRAYNISARRRQTLNEKL